MNKMRRSRKLAALVAFVMIFFSVDMRAYAGIVNTGAIIAVQQSTHAREYLATLLEREDVRVRMTMLGVDPEMARMRVAALSDNEVQSLADKIERMPAGGDMGSILAIALIVFLVLLFTDIAGYTDLFPWVKKKAGQ